MYKNLGIRNFKRGIRVRLSIFTGLLPASLARGRNDNHPTRHCQGMKYPKQSRKTTVNLPSTTSIKTKFFLLTNVDAQWQFYPRKSMKQPTIYIMTNKRNGTLYTGVTSNLIQRVYQHKQNLLPGFTKRYECKNLVYYEFFDEMEGAIYREKQLKAGPRKQKLKLIETLNPEWNDLYESICG